MKKTVTLLLCILMIVSVLFGCSEAISWDNLILADIIPEPNSVNGEIIIDSDENLCISLVNFSDDEFNQYIALCEDRGFNTDSKKDNSSFNAYNKDGYYLDLYYLEDDKELTINLYAPIKMDTLKWPINELSKMLPAPESEKGYIDWEYEDSFYLYIGDTTIEDFKEYVTMCSDAGFSVDYSKGDDYYYSDNEDGYHIDLYFKGFNTMSISFSSPDNEPSVKDTDTSESIQSSDKTTESKKDKDNSSQKVDSVRTDFMDAMNSYEEFINEYVDFMKKYAESDGSDLTLLADYADYLQEYADMVNSFEKWENEDLNDEELTYYIEVQSRVSQKLLEVTQ